MVNYNNYSSRYNPSVHTGRTNIWNGYDNYANNRRMAFMAQSYQAPLFNFEAPPMGGYTQVNIQNGPSKAMMQGNVLGQVADWGRNLYNQYQPQITNFFHKIFG